MAIVNSIAMGKAKGSAGDVTFAIVKGQQIAKQKVPKKGSIAPANQSASQIQMGNFVRGWQLLAVFFVFAVKLAKSTESVYNAVARMCKKGMDEIINDSRAFNATMILTMNEIIGNWGLITSVTRPLSETVRVNFGNGGLPYAADLHIRIIELDSDTGANEIKDRVITEAEWNANTLTVTGMAGLGNCTAAYIYSVDKTKISNVFGTTD